MEHRIQLPLTGGSAIEKICAGDFLLLTGTIYTARDQAHKRMLDALSRGGPLPFDPAGAGIYYCGPTPPRKDGLFGSAGPTTSSRMDGYTVPLLQRGLKVTIGKGARAPSIRKACMEYQALYLVTFGGAGAYLAKRISAQETVAYPDLGAEAVFRLEIRDFPAIAAYDTAGGSIF